jgi:hypothetical protein
VNDIIFGDINTGLNQVYKAQETAKVSGNGSFDENERQKYSTAEDWHHTDNLSNFARGIPDLCGVNHLTVARVEFLAQVPPWVPLDGDLVVVLSVSRKLC